MTVIKSPYPVDLYRADFPALELTVGKHPLVYLDNTATTQTPSCVVKAIEHAYFNTKANVHRGVHTLSREATDLQEGARERVSSYIGAASSREIIFTRGTTEAINLVASSFGSLLKEGAEIVLTVMEHHANIVPWQLLQTHRPDIKLVPVGLLPDGSLDMDALRAAITDRTGLVSVCHVSNVLGTVNPIAEIIRLAHSHGVPVLIDGAQAVGHIQVNVTELDADFYTFSAHKMYGPTGVGVLYGKEKWLEQMPPYQGGGEMIDHVSFEKTTFASVPLKFEAGTPDFIGISALQTAIDYISAIGLENIAAHEDELLTYTTTRMLEIPGMNIYGQAAGKAPIISFTVDGTHPYDIGALLDNQGVAVRTGHHCAEPLMRALGIEGCVRASFGLYNTKEEADRFLSALHRSIDMLR